MPQYLRQERELSNRRSRKLHRIEPRKPERSSKTLDHCATSEKIFRSLPKTRFEDFLNTIWKLSNRLSYRFESTYPTCWSYLSYPAGHYLDYNLPILQVKQLSGNIPRTSATRHPSPSCPPRCSAEEEFSIETSRSGEPNLCKEW